MLCNTVMQITLLSRLYNSKGPSALADFGTAAAGAMLQQQPCRSNQQVTGQLYQPTAKTAAVSSFTSIN